MAFHTSPLQHSSLGASSACARVSSERLKRGCLNHIVHVKVFHPLHGNNLRLRMHSQEPSSSFPVIGSGGEDAVHDCSVYNSPVWKAVRVGSPSKEGSTANHQSTSDRDLRHHCQYPSITLAKWDGEKNSSATVMYMETPGQQEISNLVMSWETSSKG